MTGIGNSFGLLGLFRGSRSHTRGSWSNCSSNTSCHNM